MNRKLWLISMIVACMLLMTACGGNNNGGTAANTTAEPATASAANETSTEQSAEDNQAVESEMRTITYLGEEYVVPSKAERIVITGAMEALEDALVLDVHPVGAITFSGEFPERFAAITDQAESVGEKSQPNFETILKLKPDVILASTKFPEETIEQLKKIGLTIQVSHIAENWEANLQLLGELTGKQEQAAQAIAQYKSDLETSKAQLTEKLKDQDVLALRVRSGKLFVYPTTVFLNPILYNDLGLPAPEAVQSAEAQQEISLEQFAAMNPDHLFIQFSESENKDNTNALDELMSNPIVQNIQAVKNDQVYVNMIDPLSEGGPAWSRIAFLKAATEQLMK